MADGLELTARALESDDDELAERAMASLRELRDRMAELSRTRRASSRVVRHSLLWRTMSKPVVRESENAGHLDLLDGSCLLVAHSTSPARPLAARHGPSRPSPPASPSGWPPPMSWCLPASIPVRPPTQCGRAAERSMFPTRRPSPECHSTRTVGAHLADVRDQLPSWRAAWVKLCFSTLARCEVIVSGLDPKSTRMAGSRAAGRHDQIRPAFGCRQYSSGSAS